MSWMLPVPSVVRSTVSSWISTGTPSDVQCTSISIASAPSRSAASMPGERVLRRVPLARRVRRDER